MWGWYRVVGEGHMKWFHHYSLSVGRATMMESPQLLAFRMLPDYSKPRGSDVSDLSEADSMGLGDSNTRPLHPTFKPIPVISIDTEEDEQLEKEIIKATGYSTFLHPSSAGNPHSRLSSPISFISVTSSRISSRLDFEASKTMCTKSLGLLLAFVSGVLMTAYSSMIKMLHDMDSMQVVVMRGVLQMVVMGSIAVYNKRSFIGPKDRFLPFLLFLVSLTGGLRLLFIFTSFSRLPLGDSTTIVFSSPVFVMLFSICILKETLFLSQTV